MDLKESVRQWVLRELPYDRGDADLTAYLAGLDAHRLLLVYQNWTCRLVKPQPRVVFKSKAFQENPATTQRAGDLAQIIEDIEQGQDLRKYLSRDVIRTPAGVPGRRRRPDLDLMLNDWGVHHLHISSVVEADGFVKRDDPLLFVSFRPHAAYLIDIMKHGDWTRDHVLEVLATEWPNEGVIYETSDVTPMNSKSITEEQRANLRANRYNAAFSFRGKDFVPIGLMMSPGTTMTSWLTARQLLRKIDVFEDALTTNPRCFAVDFKRAGLDFPDVPVFEFAITKDGAGIMEIKTGAWMSLMSNLSRRLLHP